ncbi:MAG: DUF1648 domain-containing protein [Anaerolineae bacterium]|nr:DUF1648 domain-containing protein [Anaerolineae bacterium]
MTFQPYPTRSGFLALIVAILAATVVIFLLTLLPQGVSLEMPIDCPEVMCRVVSLLFQQSDPFDLFKIFIGLLVALLVVIVAFYWAAIAFKLHYHLSRNGLAIQWGLIEYRIPVDHIEAIIPAQTVAESARFWGLNLAGLRYGWGRLAGFSPLKFYAAAPLVNSLLVITLGRTYVISPQQPDRFLQAWQSRQSLGPTQEWSTGMRRSWPLNTPLLADPLAWWLLGLAGLLWLALLGYLAFTFADLPAVLPVHFNALGRADRIAGKWTLLLLPTIGVAVVVFNALLGEVVYRREKLAAYLLWGSTIIMQICLGVAASMITA